ncbi:MAG: hypothetical protein GF421_00020 [Candidatus Aminicenantes bacterium]|nr:hypothetical protein [Candidatus Aminicenantes bacterium]
MKRWIILLVIFSLLSVPTLASNQQGKFQVGISFEPLIPQGEFGDVLDHMGWGGSLDVFYRIPKSDLMIGTVFAYHVYGWDTRWEPLSMYIPDVWVKVRTSNALIRGHLVLRIQPSFGYMRPYVEGLVGLQHLTTDTRVYDDYDYENNLIASTNQLRSTVLSYGLGGGLVMNLSRLPYKHRRRRFSIMLDIGIRYLQGGSAEYLIPGDIEVIGDTVHYFINRSQTDILTPKIGVTFMF